MTASFTLTTFIPGTLLTIHTIGKAGATGVSVAIWTGKKAVGAGLHMMTMPRNDRGFAVASTGPFYVFIFGCMWRNYDGSEAFDTASRNGSHPAYAVLGFRGTPTERSRGG